MDEAHLLFREGPYGLLAPVGTKVGNLFFPSDPKKQPSTREQLFRFRLGVVPQFDDIWPTEQPTLEGLFQALPRETWLSFLSRFAIATCSHAISFTRFEQSVAALLTEEQRQALARRFSGVQNTRLLDGFAILLALELAAFMALDKPPVPEFTFEQGQSLLKPIFLLSQQLHGSLNPKILSAPAGVAAALAERSLLGDPMLFLLRAFALWVQNHPQLSDASKAFRKLVDEALKKTIDVSLGDWVAVINLTAAMYLSKPLSELTSGMQVFDTTKLNIPSSRHAAFDAVLAHLSRSMQDFAARCQQVHEQRPLWERPSLVPLRESPLIRLDSSGTKVAPLSIIHFANAAIEAPLRILRQSGVENPFAGFGYLIEDYVHFLLASMYHDRYERLDPANWRDRADGVIWYEDGFIVVEVKARRIADGARYQLREDEVYSNELVQRGLNGAVEQIRSTIDDILTGVISAPTWSKAGRIGSLIVVLEEMPLNIIAESVLTAVLPQTEIVDGIVHLRPQVIGLSELEVVDEWRERRLIDILNAKMRDESASIESLKTYLQFKAQPPLESEFHSTQKSAIQQQIGQWFRQ